MKLKMNNQKIIKNKNISLKNIKYWRWLGFILAVVGAYILGNADVLKKWLGWTICFWYPALFGLSWELKIEMCPEL